MSVARLEPVAVRSTVDEITARVRDAILAGDIGPGEHLAERTLGAELGVSNIALREAFGRLAEEGLVLRVPRRGAFVASISPERVRDLTHVRVLLEQECVVLAMNRWTPAADAEAAGIVQEMRVAARQRQGERVFRLDQTFHPVFWRAARSETLLELTTNLRGRIARSIREAMVSGEVGDLDYVARIHGEWLDAVRSGDEARARAEVEGHIVRAAEAIVRRLEASG